MPDAPYAGIHQMSSRSGISRPGLAVDTSFARHKATVPEQVYPRQPGKRELTFVSIADEKAAKTGTKGSLRARWEHGLALLPSAVRSTSQTTPDTKNVATRPSFDRTIPTSTTPSAVHAIAESTKSVAVHKRIRGLRPSPFDLTRDVSPSDRAITIGLALPCRSMSEHTITTQATLRPQVAELCQTPTIVITPAKEEFDLPDHTLYARRDHRASSTYSRYTNDGLRRGDTPPVPPLPLFVGGKGLENSAQKHEMLTSDKSRDTTISVRTVFEEDEHLHHGPSSAQTLASQSHVPTPRRSRGWWNVITSPFSAGSRHNPAFWRSPSAFSEDDDQRSILADASNMSTVDSHAGVIFVNRAPGDDELRSAVPLATTGPRPNVPKRCGTAPGALDASGAAINIYRVPSQGLAAAYYDTSRHFPSLNVDGGAANIMRGSMVGWSPSQSVAHPEDVCDRELPIHDSGAVGKNGVRGIEAADSHSALSDGPNPFADEEEHEINIAPARPLLSSGAERNILSTPSEAELQGAGSSRPAAQREMTDVTLAAHFSPLSPTPVLENAHVATYMGPRSTHGELRQLELTPARSASPVHYSPVNQTAELLYPGLQDRTVAMSEPKTFMRPAIHTRNDSASSLGLGITDGEKELYPAPRAYIERARLGTDRFGQLTIQDSEKRGPYIPWYRRFFWLLAAMAGVLLLMLVMLLVMLIPQSHNDMAVQASWMNLTGFPALPTGIATSVQPALAKDVSGCVQPESLWSCSAPPDQHNTQSPPNFRFEIRFRNGTLPSNEAQLAKRSSNAALAGQQIPRRDGLADSRYTPVPATPSQADQSFIGQYVDNNTAPFSGEKTPFYLSLLDPSALSAPSGPTVGRRQEGSPYPYPNLQASNTTTNVSTSSTAPAHIPKPHLNANGQPTDPVLYPYVQAQPLHLFNRGTLNEHYGFYNYFDRTLFISTPSNRSLPNTGTGLPSGGEGAEGNVPLSNATAVCTWSQTRLHIQIWTRNGSLAALADPIPLNGLPARNSTANESAAPGSFPYPVTVTVDRHSGPGSSREKEGVGCYGLDAEKRVEEGTGMWVDEGSGVGSVKSRVRRGGSEQGNGGGDGGEGGCTCQWRNWT
ncbi:hypothetical protein LTR62_004944 [Meristemomyces frigidus]|uniref:Uncharacterized protein n=1 Tax=Meristemomyces frigidus TaxID=1508187 RepID=A0AAN7YK54_9PEZI|nr:hypothetical protein LTR62_004944 [Meristemomyces frigidus]